MLPAIDILTAEILRLKQKEEERVISAHLNDMSWMISLSMEVECMLSILHIS